MLDAARLEIGRDHLVDGAVDPGEALRKVISNAAEDLLHIFVQPALNETRGAPPSVLDGAAARVNIVSQPLELADDLLLGACLLMDPLQLTLDGEAKRTGNRFGCVRGRLVQHVIRRVEHPPEEVQLAGKDLESQTVGVVVRRDEVDDRHVVLLTIAVTAADALLDPLRVPGEIVVHDHIAELKIQTLGTRLCCDHDARPRLEFVYERKADRDIAADLLTWRALGQPAIERLRGAH